MKCALVTGASRGIGRAICHALAQDHNYYIIINYQTNRQAAEETLQEISALGVKGELLCFDVTSETETTNSLNNWLSINNDKHIEVIINNAGITKDGLFMWMDTSDWQTVIKTSVDGFYHVTKTLLQDMLQRKYGRIINVSSISGLKGTAGQVNYSAAKAALIGATKALAQEVAKKNITVNAVAPGFIRSDMTAHLSEIELVKHIPSKRFGEAKEVADLVSFLVSKKAAYITGEVININGGLYS